SRDPGGACILFRIEPALALRRDGGILYIGLWNLGIAPVSVQGSLLFQLGRCCGDCGDRLWRGCRHGTRLAGLSGSVVTLVKMKDSHKEVAIGRPKAGRYRCKPLWVLVAGRRPARRLDGLPSRRTSWDSIICPRGIQSSLTLLGWWCGRAG